ncbi:P-loop containing nucleoside triphosphate hydrolase protein [Suillus clintonianus]|uniref:P-loop containing nucleoside triphosphate hydrolase protein n=1 Tax=Suillus clintonianus TaxID=1904413 RepID=UPI001B86F0C4|nr:P-loop containing nucleoside triphosphate hydrolase protein [Suillus clintonianus]KAG2148001.1 P-loop containing nucleoside triphosphate hydrolase protein [Suillus clintonianus]
MPQIRKKTSKRGTTHQRQKLKHKVSQGRKKAKKEARKEQAAGKTHKKSKKDPGTPNNFPYKDQILAEVAESRRQAADEKQRRKDEKRAALTGLDVKDVEDSQKNTMDIDIDENQNDGQGFDGIMSIRPAPPVPPKKKTIEPSVLEPVIPVTAGPHTLREVLEKADVLLHVVDARDPAAGLSEALFKEAKGKVILLLVNKIDCIPRESLALWLSHLRLTYNTLPFRVAEAFLPSKPNPPPVSKKTPVKMDDALGSDALWQQLSKLKTKKSGDELVVALTGVTNSGKSAVINSLARADVMPIYNLNSAISAKGPYTTTSASELVLEFPDKKGTKLRLIDTPGLEYVRAEGVEEQEKEMTRARDILLRSRGRIDRLKDPLFAVTHIVSRADTQDLMLAYSLPAFSKGDPASFLAGMARASGLIKKRGVLDHAGAARIVLRDWSIGKFARYTMPPGSSTISSSTNNEGILAMLKSRKELRKAEDVKLIQLQPGEAEKREVSLDDVWGVDEEISEVDDEDAEDEEAGGDEDAEDEEARGDEDEDEDEVEVDQGNSKSGEAEAVDDDEEDEEEVPELLPPPKRKRTVSFAAVPAGGKRLRRSGKNSRRG